MKKTLTATHHRNNSWTVTKDIDIIYSVDENSYYFMDFSLYKMTKLYPTLERAVADYEDDVLIWDDPEDMSK